MKCLLVSFTLSKIEASISSWTVLTRRDEKVHEPSRMSAKLAFKVLFGSQKNLL